MPDDNDLDAELDDLLQEFSDTTGTQSFSGESLPPAQIQNLSTPEDLEQFTSQKTQEFLSDLMSVTKTLLVNAKTTGDPALLTSLTSLLSNTTKIIDVFNKQVIVDKNNKTKLELQQSKNKNITKGLVDGIKGVISSREEAFKNILQQERDIKEAIPIEKAEENSEEEENFLDQTE